MNNFVISEKIEAKLKMKHGVECHEVYECFANIEGKYLLDTREGHASNPPTRWFIAETNYGRLLKIVFIFKDNKIFLRSAFPPNEAEISMYESFGK